MWACPPRFAGLAAPEPFWNIISVAMMSLVKSVARRCCSYNSASCTRSSHSTQSNTSASGDTAFAPTSSSVPCRFPAGDGVCLPCGPGDADRAVIARPNRLRSCSSRAFTSLTSAVRALALSRVFASHFRRATPPFDAVRLSYADEGRLRDALRVGVGDNNDAAAVASAVAALAFTRSDTPCCTLVTRLPMFERVPHILEDDLRRRAPVGLEASRVDELRPDVGVTDRLRRRENSSCAKLDLRGGVSGIELSPAVLLGSALVSSETAGPRSTAFATLSAHKLLPSTSRRRRVAAVDPSLWRCLALCCLCWACALSTTSLHFTSNADRVCGRRSWLPSLPRCAGTLSSIRRRDRRHMRMRRNFSRLMPSTKRLSSNTTHAM